MPCPRAARLSTLFTMLIACIALTFTVLQTSRATDATTEAATTEAAMLQQLDAPLLFVKRHSYSGIHIYDTYYKWPPGGGGIYVLENPSSPRAEWVIRPVIDPTTQETLGVGVYSDPELSWDAQRLLFCFKGEPTGNTCIYEIGVDGTGLRQLSNPAPSCSDYRGSQHGQHDVAPAYLPDGRIAFLSTRLSGLVPCNNTGVAILHVMRADGSDMHAISVNNVNEFDPCPLPDGRILLGRWEYVDKNALTIQSLWTMNPDGTQETAFYANNMVFPESILDARPVPNSRFIVGTFAKHNSTPRGSIALVDPMLGKNNPNAIFNFEHADNPTRDTGESCEPWPISRDLVLFSGRPKHSERNAIEMVDSARQRIQVLSDPEYCLHSPMLVKARPQPPVIASSVDRSARSGRFYVQDIYDGLPDVKRGEIKWLRVIEETSRTSERTDGANPYNQTFLLSSALAFSVKNYLGIVPVSDDGAAYFEVPAGRAVYFQALDQNKRLVQSMRTFVQAAPGTTRSCIGCHEHKHTATKREERFPAILRDPPSQLKPESWGSGHVDYASMVQPVLDRRCVRCHGGEQGIAGGMDLSGGWTEHFNISYENLTNRARTQLVAHWIAGIDCMNGTALWSAQLFPPRTHGSGAAPLAELLVDGHDGHIDDLTDSERELILAWIDTNGLYYGTWHRTASGCQIASWQNAKNRLTDVMQRAGCVNCHGTNNRLLYFENDWINLQDPEHSRLLRAPLAAGDAGLGLAWCRKRSVSAERQRVHLLRNGYAHAVQPPQAFTRHPLVVPDRSGEPVVSFASTTDPHYQEMLAIIQETRLAALAVPRVDMPGADVQPGASRAMLGQLIPDLPIELTATIQSDGAVLLQWTQLSQWIGMEFEVFRSQRPDFALNNDNLLMRTPLFSLVDSQAPTGRTYYAVRATASGSPASLGRVELNVPRPSRPPVPKQLRVLPSSGTIDLQWQPATDVGSAYHVYRSPSKTGEPVRLTDHPLAHPRFFDGSATSGQQYFYHVRTVSRRGAESLPSAVVSATAKTVLQPVFLLPLESDLQAMRFDRAPVAGRSHGKVQVSVDAALDLRQTGFVTFPHDRHFDLSQPVTITCRVQFTERGTMPVVLSCGAWGQDGWFLQRLGNRWRWYVGGLNCDGGAPQIGSWCSLVATADGSTARLYQNGSLVAEQTGTMRRTSWPGELHVGQYSGGPSPVYQVHGLVKDVRIYHRILSDTEIQQFGSESQ